MPAIIPTVPVSPSPSARPGMGTILFPGGVAFRVWAPFASSVFAAGAFNQWNATANPFASEGNGYWSVEVPGAAVGDEYQFVIHNGAQVLWHKNPYASEVVNSSGNAIIHDPNFDWTGEDFVMPPRNELVIYEMHVGSFNDSNGGGPGTFDEIIPKLSYLRDLGINAIEIMPVLEFPMSFSWGYNPSDPFAVESSLGGPQGLQRFVKAAHALGIAIIMDVVYNHFGPGDLDLWRFDGWSDPDHNGGIYFYDNDRSHTDWGDTRPDYGRPEVRQYLRDNALFWLNKYRIDGLRFDSVSNIRMVDGRDLPDGWSLLQWMHDEIRSTQPWKITIAEDLQNNEWITKESMPAAQASVRNGTPGLSIPSGTPLSRRTTPIGISMRCATRWNIVITTTPSSGSSTPNPMTRWRMVTRGCRRRFGRAMPGAGFHASAPRLLRRLSLPPRVSR